MQENHQRSQSEPDTIKNSDASNEILLRQMSYTLYKEGRA